MTKKIVDLAEEDPKDIERATRNKHIKQNAK